MSFGRFMQMWQGPTMEEDVAPKTVAILGGIVAANDLRRKLPGEHGSSLWERNAEHAFSRSFLWLMTGDRRPDQIRQPLAKLLVKGVEFTHGSVERFDLPRQQIAMTAGNIGYDYLIVALGAELAPEAVPGLKEGAETLGPWNGCRQVAFLLGADHVRWGVLWEYPIGGVARRSQCLW